MSMEFVADGTLKDRLNKLGPLPPAEAVELILQVIDGLEAAAAKGVLHRDIKPSNCFVDANGKVKVGDFGLSISTMARDETHLTASRAMVGTPAFASPEQLQGKELDVRSDIYSVGATLFFLITGQPPFQKETLLELLADIASAPPRIPPEQVKTIPKRLQRSILRCLSKRRTDRPHDYALLRGELLFSSEAAATPTSPLVRVLAGFIDSWATAMLTLLPFFFLLGDRIFTQTVRLQSLDLYTESDFYLLTLGLGVGYALYYSVLEGRWGAAAGKVICRCRVVGPDLEAPGALRALHRFLVFYLVPLTVSHLGNLTWLWLGPEIAPPFSMIRGYFFYCLGVLLLFSCARKRNGWAGIHELLSGTRVIRKRHLRSPSQTEQRVGSTQLPTVEDRTFGPYAVLRTLWSGETDELLEGYDHELQRRVWIHVCPSDTPAVNAARRSLARAGRIRWLSGRRDPQSWDAYEAIEGKSLLDAIGERQSWSTVRRWLERLLAELSSQTADSSFLQFAPEQVWVGEDQRICLLEFPGPDSKSVTSQTEPIASEDFALVQGFLATMATAALEGKGGSDSTNWGKLCRAPSLPLPLQARGVLESLRKTAFTAPIPALSELQDTGGAEVTRRRRLSQILSLSALPGFLVVGLLLGLLSSDASSGGDMQELIYLGQCLSWLENSKQRPAQGRPDYEAQMEVYIASQFGELFSKESWDSPFGAGRFPATQRRLFEEIIERNPAPSTEERRLAIGRLNRVLIYLSSERPETP